MSAECFLADGEYAQPFSVHDSGHNCLYTSVDGTCYTQFVITTGIQETKAHSNVN